MNHPMKDALDNLADEVNKWKSRYAESETKHGVMRRKIQRLIDALVDNYDPDGVVDVNAVVLDLEQLLNDA